MKKILIIGIGNSGRGDDGLGWKLAEKAEELFHDVCDVEFRYQLQVEEAELISHYDLVIFADATHKNLEKGFSFDKCFPAGEYFFSSHIQSPQTVLYLSNSVFEKFPAAFVLALEGKEWEMKSNLSKKAEGNIEEALAFLKRWMDRNAAKKIDLSALNPFCV